MKLLYKIFLIITPLAIVVAAPLVLRDDETEGANEANMRLDVITPHTETLRREFGEAFSQYWEKKNGKRVNDNFLVPLSYTHLTLPTKREE